EEPQAARRPRLSRRRPSHGRLQRAHRDGAQVPAGLRRRGLLRLRPRAARGVARRSEGAPTGHRNRIKRPAGRIDMTGLLTRAVAVAAALAALTSSAAPQSFPDRTVKIVVPTAPGGAIDLTGRVIAEKMQAKWGKPVIVENRPGAAMRLGAEAVQKS